MDNFGLKEFNFFDWKWENVKKNEQVAANEINLNQ